MDSSSSSSRSETAIRELLALILEIDPASIEDCDGIYRTRNWDSLAHLEIILALEDLLGVQIGDEAIEEMMTVAEIKRFVMTQKENVS